MRVLQFRDCTVQPHCIVYIAVCLVTLFYHHCEKFTSLALREKFSKSHLNCLIIRSSESVSRAQLDLCLFPKVVLQRNSFTEK